MTEIKKIAAATTKLEKREQILQCLQDEFQIDGRVFSKVDTGILEELLFALKTLSAFHEARRRLEKVWGALEE